MLDVLSLARGGLALEINEGPILVEGCTFTGNAWASVVILESRQVTLRDNLFQDGVYGVECRALDRAPHLGDLTLTGNVIRRVTTASVGGITGNVVGVETSRFVVRGNTYAAGKPFVQWAGVTAFTTAEMQAQWGCES